MPGKRKNWYDTALICLNGHIITDSIRLYPEQTSKFCAKCGEITITKCQKCDTDIRGIYCQDYTPRGSLRTPPKYCHNCGFAFPWTEKGLQAARALFSEISELNEEDKIFLTQSLDELVKNTPQTEFVATKFKKIMAKAGKEIAEAAKRVLIDIVSETAKRVIWPQ